MKKLSTKITLIDDTMPNNDNIRNKNIEKVIKCKDLETQRQRQ